MTPSGRLPVERRGWKEIADALKVSVRRAQELAARAEEPLPVRKDHRGVYALVSRLQDWVDAEDLAYAAHLRLVRARSAERSATCGKNRRAGAAA